MRMESGFKRRREDNYPADPSLFKWRAVDVSSLPPLPADGASSGNVYHSGDVEVTFDKDSKVKEKMTDPGFHGFFQVKKGGGVHVEL